MIRAVKSGFNLLFMRYTFRCLSSSGRLKSRFSITLERLKTIVTRSKGGLFFPVLAFSRDGAAFAAAARIAGGAFFAAPTHIYDNRNHGGEYGRQQYKIKKIHVSTRYSMPNTLPP
jgi:hypothetical protein